MLRLLLIPENILAANRRLLPLYPSRAAQWLVSHTAVVFLMWSLWLSLEFIALGPSSFARMWDEADSYIPARIALANMFLDGEFSSWNPQWASGADILSSGLYPLSDVLLFAIAPDWLAYGLFMWVQRFVAGYFSYRLLKDSVKLDTLPSLFGGFAYSLFAQSTFDFVFAAGFHLYDGLGLPGLPFVLWALDRTDLDRKYRPFMYSAGIGALLAISSYFYFTMFFFPVFFCWFVFVRPRRERRFWGVFALFTVAWLVSAWPVMWSSLLNAPLSQRVDWTPDAPIPLVPTWTEQLPNLLRLARDNMAALGLFALGLAVSRGIDRRLISLAGIMMLLLTLILLNPVIQTHFHERLGFLSGFDFSRLFYSMPFLITMAGAVGLHLAARKWNEGRSSQASIIPRSAFLVVAVVAALSLLAWQSLDVKRQTLRAAVGGECFDCLYTHPDIQRLAENTEQLPPFRVATIATDRQRPAYAWTYGLETADGYINLYPRRYKQFWEQVVAPLTASDESVYNLLHYWGSKTYLFAPSGGFPDNEEVHFQKFYDLELLSLANVRYVISALPIQDDNLILLPAQSRNNYTKERENQGRLSRLLDRLSGQRASRPIYIYENQQVLPRFFLTSQTRVLDESSKVLAALREASYSDLRTTAYMEQADAEGLPLSKLNGQGGTVSLGGYSSGRITLNVVAESPSVLVVANSYSPYWKARVDDVETRVLPVNHAFQGVYVDAGQHEVVLEYASPYAIGSRR